MENLEKGTQSIPENQPEAVGESQLDSTLEKEKEEIFEKYREKWNGLLEQKELYNLALHFLQNPSETQEVRNYKPNIQALENQMSQYLDKDFSYGKTGDTGELYFNPSFDLSEIKNHEEIFRIGNIGEKIKENPEAIRMFERTLPEYSDRLKKSPLRNIFSEMSEKTNLYLNAVSESERGEEYVKERYKDIENKISDLEKKRDAEISELEK